MAKVTARKNIARSLIEFRSFEGKSGKRYLVVKGHLRKADFFNAFVAVELKEAALDILGESATSEKRKAVNANDLAKQIWYEKVKAVGAGG